MLLNSWSVHMNGLKFCDIQIIFLTAFLSHMYVQDWKTSKLC